MTLGTVVLIPQPTDPGVEFPTPRAIFDHAVSLLARDPGVTWDPMVRPTDEPPPTIRADRVDWYMEHIASPGWTTVLGQGLAAICDVKFNPDGPYRWLTANEHTTEDDLRDPGFEPVLCRLHFDTGYAYHGPRGGRCTDLHAWLVDEMGAWLAERGVPEFDYWLDTYDWVRWPDARPYDADPELGRLG